MKTESLYFHDMKLNKKKTKTKKEKEKRKRKKYKYKYKFSGFSHEKNLLCRRDIFGAKKKITCVQ